MNSLSTNPNTDEVIIAYNSKDFFWKSANYNDKYCDLPQCSIDPRDINSTMITSKNIENCFKKEVCNNKVISQTLQQIETTHSGSDGRYMDTKNRFRFSILNTCNLGIGIITIIYVTNFIY